MLAFSAWSGKLIDLQTRVVDVLQPTVRGRGLLTGSFSCASRRIPLHAGTVSFGQNEVTGKPP